MRRKSDHMKVKQSENQTNKSKKIVLAYSGGLDTSFCIPFLKEKYDAEVITVTVDTGGFTKKELKRLEDKSKKLGAKEHYTIDAKYQLFDEFISYLIKGNVLKGGVYPLCVGAERVLQAVEIAKLAKNVNAKAIAHGSTSAGNDQVRFDVVFNVLTPDLEIITPIRDLELAREDETAYLEKKGFNVKEETTKYSINTGLWGTTIGGGECHDCWAEIPEDAYKDTTPIEETPFEQEVLEIGFKEGVPISLNGNEIDGVKLLKQLNKIGGKHGVGKGIHIGDTIMGIKGRIAFEAPGALILIEAHKELEKIVLSKWQRYWKDQIGEFFGMLLHEAMYFDPVVKDMKKFLDSTQTKVSGDVKVRLIKGNILITGCKSPYSLLQKENVLYGEEAKLWTGIDARGFCKIFGMSSGLSKIVENTGDDSGENESS